MLVTPCGDRRKVVLEFYLVCVHEHEGVFDPCVLHVTKHRSGKVAYVLGCTHVYNVILECVLEELAGGAIRAAMV